jgi:predicted O-methyltransferase YrrM
MLSTTSSLASARKRAGCTSKTAKAHHHPMKPDEISKIIGRVPYMRAADARIFYDLITTSRLRRCLELGFFHGVSSTYLAGALKEVDGGHLITIDLERSRTREPNIHSLLQQTGLMDLVDVCFEPKTYNWRLMRLLQAGQENSFDFAYIDGGHTWDDTGLAVLLTQRLLAPGGWIALDDLYFTFRASSNCDRDWVRRMPEEEQTEPQVLRVFELLVQKNPGFTNFRRMRKRFAFAQKVLPQSSGGPAVLSAEVSIGIAAALERAHDDPEYRQDLFSSPKEALADIFGTNAIETRQLVFEEANSFGPKPTWRRDDGVFVVPVEQPSWAYVHNRLQLQEILTRSS